MTIVEYTRDVVYPCGREELLRSAAANGADENILGHLGALPELEFDSWEMVERHLHDIPD